ncbi:hypothetical protein FB446DRAFT_704269 [Lentinula raphanica]|nr:hypothetical protein FB446DRAFT_704269 [Lentinula raphanica]
MALLSFLRLLPAILLLRPVLMAPTFIPGIPSGTSSGASGSTPASESHAVGSGYAPALGYAAGYADTGFGPAPGYAAHTPSEYAHTGYADTHRYDSAPGYPPVGSGYAPGHTRAALGYASVAPGYASAPGYATAPGSVPPGSSAINTFPPSWLPPKPEVEELPVYFVVVRSDGGPLQNSRYSGLRWGTQREIAVGFQIGNNAKGHVARKDSTTGSITIDPGRKPVRSGVRIGTLTLHSGKSQDIVTGMWEEIDKATFASQFEFLQTTERKLRQKGEALKREDPRLGWVQSGSEEQQMNMLFGKVKPLGEKSKKDTGEDETGRDVLMAPPFIPGISPGTSSGASSGYADTPAGYAYTPAGYAHTPSGSGHTPAPGYGHTPAPGYAAGSGYAAAPAAFGYAAAPGYIPTPGSVPPGSSAVNVPPLSESFPEPGVEELPVYFVAVKSSDSRPLERTYYNSDWSATWRLEVGIQIGIDAQSQGRVAKDNGDGSITIRPRKPVQSGARIGTLKLHPEKRQVVTEMWKEIDKATFTSRSDFVQKIVEKLGEIRVNLMREDLRLGWVQSNLEEEKMHSMFTRVEGMKKKEDERQKKMEEEENDEEQKREKERRRTNAEARRRQRKAQKESEAERARQG